MQISKSMFNDLFADHPLPDSPSFALPDFMHVQIKSAGLYTATMVIMNNKNPTR